MNITVTYDEDIEMYDATFDCDQKEAETARRILFSVIESSLKGAKIPLQAQRVPFGYHYKVQDDATLEVHGDEWFPLEVWSSSKEVIEKLIKLFKIATSE